MPNLDPANFTQMKGIVNEIIDEVCIIALKNSYKDIEKICDSFINDVTSGKYWITKIYPSFATSFNNAVRASLASSAERLLGPIGISKRNNNIQSLISIKNFDVSELDRQTDISIKRGLDGSKRKFKSDSRMGGGGWWRFFEFGSSDRNWGSDKYAFIPSYRARGSKSGKIGGGLMVPLSDLSKSPIPKKWSTIFNIKAGEQFKPHPGVKKLGMFQRTWNQYKSIFQSKVPDIIEKNINKIPYSTILTITKNVLSKRGIV